MSKITSIAAALILALGAGAGCKERRDDAALTSVPKPLEQRPADNTGTNERDRSPTETTAQHADNDRTDLDIMARIRQLVVDDDALSTNAHNVKIVAENGVVTLKGPVANPAERDAIIAKAQAVVDPKNIVDQLEIAPQ